MCGYFIYHAPDTGSSLKQIGVVLNDTIYRRVKQCKNERHKKKRTACFWGQFNKVKICKLVQHTLNRVDTSGEECDRK